MRKYSSYYFWWCCHFGGRRRSNFLISAFEASGSRSCKRYGKMYGNMMNKRKNMAKAIQHILTMVFDSMKSCNCSFHPSKDHFWFTFGTKILFCGTSSICKTKISEIADTLFKNALLTFWKSGKTIFWLRRLFLQNCAPLTILRLRILTYFKNF